MVMSFRLKNTRVTYQRMINKVFLTAVRSGYGDIYRKHDSEDFISN
jgi:hypothetical protein